jgi:hypothetical protein
MAVTRRGGRTKGPGATTRRRVTSAGLAPEPVTEEWARASYEG